MQISQIIKHANLYFGVDIKSKTQKRKVAHPRFIVMKCIREQKGFSYPNIAKYVGLKDHTSAMHGIDKVNNNEALRAAYNGFIESLNQSCEK